MIAIRTRARQMAPVILLTAALLPWAVRTAEGATKADSQLRRGEEVAQLQCSACHVVAEKQKYPPLLEDPRPVSTALPTGRRSPRRHCVTS